MVLSRSSPSGAKIKKCISFLLAFLIMFSFVQFLYFPSGSAFAAGSADTWTLQASGTTTQLNGITYGNGLFVAVGSNKTILTSQNGIDWTQQTAIPNSLLSTENIQSVTYGNGIFVACTTGSWKILTSSNGTTWVDRGTVSDWPLLSLTYGNGTFVAVGSYGRIRTSPDGITWTSRTWSNNQGLQGVAYGKDQSNQDTFVAPCSTSLVLSSKNNGETWQINSTGSKTNYNLYFAAYGNGKFLVGGDFGFVATSEDGQNWNIGNARTNVRLNAAAYGNGTYIMVGSTTLDAKGYSKEFSTFASVNGLDWRQIDVTTDQWYELNDITYGNGTFVAVGNNGSILTSQISGTKAHLESINVGDGTLRPGFNTFCKNYMDYIDFKTTSTTITATAASAGDTISINGVPQESGVPKTIELAPGANAVNIVVTSQDGTAQNTYRVMLNRMANRLMSAGYYHAMAVKPDGTVVDWGTYDNNKEIVLPPLSGIVQVAAGQNHSLALKSDGSVVAWGYDLYNPVTVPSDLANVSCIDAGCNLSLALKSDGTVAGWGSSYNSAPAENLQNIIAIDSGFDYSIALRSDDTFIGWGNDYMNKSKAPTLLKDIVDISAGKDHTLALKSDGTVIAWGYDNQGQIQVPAGLCDVIDVEAGAHHSVALKADGTVVVWGGTQDARIAAVPPGLDNVIAVSADEGYTMALKADGTVVMWGNRSLVTSMPAGLNLFNAPAMTDAEAVAADKAALTFDTIRGSNTSADSIVSNMSLPSSGSNGTAITWSSSNPAILRNDGKVTRPAGGSSDAEVTLTANISKGQSSDTKPFTLKVKAMPPDQSVPTWPDNSTLTSSNVGQTNVTLSWTGASDNIGVTGYRILKDGVIYTAVGNVLSANVTGLTPGTQYIFKVEACDAAGNWSSTGPSFTVKMAEVPADQSVPTWPESSTLTSSNVGQTNVALSWTGASDNVGVTGYRILKDGVPCVAVGKVLTADVTGLTPGTQYIFKVEACDAAGNWSSTGPSFTVKTAEVPADQSVPTWPDNSTLTSSNVGQTNVTLSWTGASDNIGVTGYRILKDSVIYAAVGNVLSAEVTDMTANTQYAFKVEACDAAGNWSSTGPSFTVKTGEAVTSDTPIVYIPLARLQDSRGNLTETIPVRTDDTTGHASVNTDLASINAAFGTSKADKSGVKTIGIDIPKIEDAKTYEIILPADVLSTYGASMGIKIMTDMATVTVPCNMLAAVETIGAETVSLTIAAGSRNNLDTAVQDQIGIRPVIELNVTVNGKKISWSNRSCYVNITIPYVPSQEELKGLDHIIALSVDGNGKASPIFNGKYDQASGNIVFTTTHSGSYAVANVHKTFNDLGSVKWAKKSIEIMASKGIMSGTGPDIFSPSASISRADYLVLLVNTLGLTAEFNDNFEDVGRNAYYYEAVGIARKLRIASGSNNRFNPTDNISRQDMIVLTARALVKCKEMKATGNIGLLERFSDMGEIADYALICLTTMVDEGLVSGSEDRLNPRTKATRAEAAMLLYRIFDKYCR